MRRRGSIVAWVVVLLNESHIIGKVRNVGGTIKIFSPISASSLFSLRLFARASQPAPPISYMPQPPKHSLSSIAGPSLSYRGVALSITGKSSSATRRMTVSEFNETTAPSGTGHPSRRPRMLSVAITSITFLGMFVNFRQLALFSSGSKMDVDDISIMPSRVVNRKKSTIDLNKNENKEAVKQQEIQRSVSSSSPTPTKEEQQERTKPSSSLQAPSPTSKIAPSCHRNCRSRPNKIVLGHMPTEGFS